MPFAQIEAEKISNAVVQQIEELILRGILHPGERLPSERELSERLDVSRPSLREAIAELQQAGLVESRKGAGIFVSADLAATFPEALVQLFSTHEEAAFDTLNFRRDIEGLAAERAARFGSDTDLMLVATLMDKMEAAHEARRSTLEAELDAEFHMAIVEAGHNSVMVHMMRSLFQLLRRGVLANRETLFGQRTTREALLAQHRAVHDAIQTREPAQARKAVEAHLDYVREALIQQIATEKHDAIAKRRLAQNAVADLHLWWSLPAERPDPEQKTRLPEPRFSIQIMC